ncbi:MAG: protein kinase [Coleofasciculaceae cyanobacterium]
MIGQTLAGRYQIIRHLGDGAFAQTYLAKDLLRPHQDFCVVKHLKPQATDAFTLQAARRLFETEAQVLNRLGNHKQIPSLLAHFEENQQFYLVQEFIDGEPLSQELTLGTQLSESEVIELLEGILEVLVFVHKEGVIHRDLKPSNLIRRRQDNKLVLIDFGAVKQISTQLVDEEGLTSFTIAIGTDGYMPPEQASGKPRLASDIYAVGMIGIRALTGITPKELPEEWKTGKILWQESRCVSRRLSRVLDKMVRSPFSQRYPSAAEALRAVRALKTQPGLSLSPLMAISVLLVTLTGLIGAWLVSSKLMDACLVQIKLTGLSKLVTYKNNDYGIKMCYPSTWELQEDIDNPFDYATTLVKFVPKQNQPTSLDVELTISVEELLSPISFDKYTTSHIAKVLDFFPDSSIKQSDHQEKLDNHPAHRLVYTGRGIENKRMKGMQIWLIKDQKSYIISYTAEASKYDDFIKPVEEIIVKSFDAK